jgi:8-amino-7-oxononanoate synthase
MADCWSEFFDVTASRIETSGLRRRRQVFDHASFVDFGTNDYLGLRNNTIVRQALVASLQVGPWGAGASPVLSGYSPQHQALEAALADFSRASDALVFSSGLACNTGTVACLAQAGDLILSDQLNHASLIDGCRLSRANRQIFPHADYECVREVLRGERARYRKVLIVTESIFSMDGDAAPLAELASLAQDYDCGLLVDEAHAVGIYGHRGSGLLEELSLQGRELAKLGTLSKALGCVGGYICGDRSLIDYLVNHCRSYMFSTAPPPATMAAATAALGQLTNMSLARQRLRQTASQLRSRLASLGLSISAGDSPIIPVILGSEDRATRLSARLATRQICVPAIRPPTVPPGTSRLRISLSSQHSPQQIDLLVSALAAEL